MDWFKEKIAGNPGILAQTWEFPATTLKKHSRNLALGSPGMHSVGLVNFAGWLTPLS